MISLSVNRRWPGSQTTVCISGLQRVHPFLGWNQDLLFPPLEAKAGCSDCGNIWFCYQLTAVWQQQVGWWASHTVGRFFWVLSLELGRQVVQETVSQSLRYVQLQITTVCHWHFPTFKLGRNCFSPSPDDRKWQTSASRPAALPPTLAA